MSLTASLLKGAKVDSSLDSLFKNSAGPALAAKSQENVQPRKTKVTDIEVPKIKQKNPKPKATQQKKQQKQKGDESDSDKDEKDSDEDDEEEMTSIDNKKKASKKSVEEKYETKKAAEAKKKQSKASAPKETRELLKKQTKYDYGEEEEDFKPEDLVHESLRNKRKASEENEDEQEETPAKKSKKDDDDDSDDDNDDEGTHKRSKADDAERRARTLFVGNLAVSAISKGDFKKLKQKFSEYGHIESIRFRSVAFSELLPRKVAFITGKLHPERDVVNAYIVYKEKESITKAVAGMNGQLFLNKHVRVDNADGEKNYNPKKSVFVGNLAFDAQEEDLWNFFKDSGDIENVRIIRDRKTNLGKGFAYVQFQDRASVDLALRLHDTKMGSRKLRVIRCKKIEDEASKTNGMQQQQLKKKGGKHDAHTTTDKPLTGAAKRLALKAAKSQGRHTVKKGGSAIVEGERATKGTKIDLGIKKGKAKAKANVPKKKKVKAPKK